MIASPTTGFQRIPDLIQELNHTFDCQVFERAE